METVPTTIQPILAELQQQIPIHYGERLAGVVLFGSQARGDANTESDIDMLVVLHDEETPEDNTYTTTLITDFLYRYDMLVSPLHISLDRFLHEQSPLLINVRNEGMLLFQDTLLPYLPKTPTTQRKKNQHMTPEQAGLLRKATESLHWAKRMASEGQHDFAASRAYYAMFYVAQSFLLSHGLSFSKHTAVIAAFGKYFVHTGIVPTELHRYLIDAHKARLRGDYEIEMLVNEAETSVMIQHAEEFLVVANQHIGPIS